MSATYRLTFAISKVVFAILFWISLAAWIYLYNHYARTSFADPDPRVGRVYRERHIGVVFYLTSDERNVLRSLTGGLPLLPLGGSLLSARKAL
jgi:hypothetical protein